MTLGTPWVGGLLVTWTRHPFDCVSTGQSVRVCTDTVWTIGDIHTGKEDLSVDVSRDRVVRMYTGCLWGSVSTGRVIGVYTGRIVGRVAETGIVLV